MTTIIRGADVRIGDDIVFLGKPRRVIRIEPYLHPRIETGARVAYWPGVHGDDVPIVLYDDALIEVAATPLVAPDGDRPPVDRVRDTAPGSGSGATMAAATASGQTRGGGRDSARAGCPSPVLAPSDL